MKSSGESKKIYVKTMPEFLDVFGRMVDELFDPEEMEKLRIWIMNGCVASKEAKRNKWKRRS